MNKNNMYVCFRCGDIGPPVEVREDKPLGLCGCHEGWFVGNVTQLCDFLNECYSILEPTGMLDSPLVEYDANDEEPEQLELPFE